MSIVFLLNSKLPFNKQNTRTNRGYILLHCSIDSRRDGNLAEEGQGSKVDGE